MHYTRRETSNSLVNKGKLKQKALGRDEWIMNTKTPHIYCDVHIIDQNQSL